MAALVSDDAYLDGALELMSPSKEHERAKSYIGRLVEAYALEPEIDLSPYGAWTLKSEVKQSGAEPDECHIVGADQSKELPDLAIEVIWTSGGIDKLEIYRRLGVGELWFWRHGGIELHVLRHERYERVDRSPLFPGLTSPSSAHSWIDQRPCKPSGRFARRFALPEDPDFRIPFAIVADGLTYPNSTIPVDAAIRETQSSDRLNPFLGGGTPNLPTSRGFEGMAITPDGKTL